MRSARRPVRLADLKNFLHTTREPNSRRGSGAQEMLAFRLHDRTHAGVKNLDDSVHSENEARDVGLGGIAPGASLARTMT